MRFKPKKVDNGVHKNILAEKNVTSDANGAAGKASAALPSKMTDHPRTPPAASELRWRAQRAQQVLRKTPPKTPQNQQVFFKKHLLFLTKNQKAGGQWGGRWGWRCKY